METWAEISTFAIYSAILSAAMMSSLLLTRRNYPEAGPRDSFGLRNQRMNAPEDRGLFPLLLVLGQLGRTDARQASAASRWKHHLTKWQCTESDGLTQKGTYFAIKGYLFCKKWSALGDPNTDSVEDD